MIYAAVAVLSLLFAADKEAALLFVLFFGYYPVLKSFLERISNKSPFLDQQICGVQRGCGGLLLFSC